MKIDLSTRIRNLFGMRLTLEVRRDGPCRDSNGNRFVGENVARVA